jgi:hypothetical protein
MSIRWQLYPRSRPPDEVAHEIASSFSAVSTSIESPANQKTSNQVLAHVRPHLEGYGFKVENPAKRIRLDVPVLFGMNGKPEKTYRVDAWHIEKGAVLEVESGAAMDAHRFHKDLLEASVMADINFFCIAVKNEYRPRRFEEARPSQRDFETAKVFLDSLYASRMMLPLDAVMLLGY